MHAAIGSPITLENPCAVTGIPFGALAVENCVAVAATPTTTRLRSVVMATLDPDPAAPHIAVGTTCTTPGLRSVVMAIFDPDPTAPHIAAGTTCTTPGLRSVVMATLEPDPMAPHIAVGTTCTTPGLICAVLVSMSTAGQATETHAVEVEATITRTTSAVVGCPFKVPPTESVRVVATPHTIHGNKDAAVVTSSSTPKAKPLFVVKVSSRQREPNAKMHGNCYWCAD